MISENMLIFCKNAVCLRFQKKSGCVNSCLCYLAFLQKGSKTLWKEGTLHFFLSQKVKSAKKEVGERAARPLAPINGPARAYLFPNVRCVSGDCTCTRKQGSRNFGSRADFANLIGALVRIRVHHANRLVSRRRDANTRWFVGSKVEICFLRGYGGKREFSCH